MVAHESWCIYLDGDDVGARIELHLVRGEVGQAADVSRQVVIAVGNTADYLRTELDAEVVFAAGDEILARTNRRPTTAVVEEMRRRFYETTGLTISCGVGASSKEAADNLRLAKLQGRNCAVGVARS